MAQVLSGSFNTTAYGGRHLTFSWTATQDTAKNQSTISWTLKGGGSYSGYYKVNPVKVVIAGETVYEVKTADTRVSVYNGTTVASGTKVITHNADGTKSFTASVSAAIYDKSVNCTGSDTWELQTIPRKATITSAPNFNDINLPTVSYSNPLGNSVEKLEMGIFNSTGGQSLVPYREVSKTGSSYTFNLTEAERNNLRNYTPNSNTASVRFYIRTTIDDTQYLDSVAKTLTIVNANPVVSVLIEDTEEETSRVTGSDKCIIKGRSVMYVSCQAEAIKGASLASCSITNSGQTTNSWEETFVDPIDSVVTCVVTDSRGNSTTQTIDLANNNLGYSWVPYIAPTCSMSASLVLDASTTSKATISASGNYYNGAIGVTPNTLTVNLIIWEEGNDTPIYNGALGTATINGNKYNVSGEVRGLDYQKTYKFQCYASDALTSSYSDAQSFSTLPVFDWSKEDFNFNVPVSFNGATMNDFVVEYGAASMGSNGTWYWQKWNSGKVECYGLRNYGNMAVTTAFGGMYRSEAFQQSLPTGLFNGAPVCCNINYAGSTSDWAAFIMPRLSASNTNTCGFYVMRPESGTISAAKISFHILGRWK